MCSDCEVYGLKEHGLMRSDCLSFYGRVLCALPRTISILQPHEESYHGELSIFPLKSLLFLSVKGSVAPSYPPCVEDHFLVVAASEV